MKLTYAKWSNFCETCLIHYLFFHKNKLMHIKWPCRTSNQLSWVLFTNLTSCMTSILLKEETDFIEPQLLWNHTKSDIFVIWSIGIMYCTSSICLWNIFSNRKRQFLWKYQNPETVIVPCFNLLRMPNRRTSQSKIEDIVHCKCIGLLNSRTA